MIKAVGGLETTNVARLLKSPRKFEQGSENKIQPFTREKKPTESRTLEPSKTLESLKDLQPTFKTPRALLKELGINLRIAGGKNMKPEEREKVYKSFTESLAGLSEKDLEDWKNSTVFVGHGTGNIEGKNHKYDGITLKVASENGEKKEVTLTELAAMWAGKEHKIGNEKVRVIACEDGRVRRSDLTKGAYEVDAQGNTREVKVESAQGHKDAIELAIHQKITEPARVAPGNSTFDLELVAKTFDKTIHGVDQDEFKGFFDSDNNLKLPEFRQTLESIQDPKKLHQFIRNFNKEVGSKAYEELKRLEIFSYDISTKIAGLGKNPRFYNTPREVFEGMEDMIQDPNYPTNPTKKVPNEVKEHYKKAFEEVVDSPGNKIFVVKHLTEARKFFFEHLLDGGEHSKYEPLLNNLSDVGQRAFIETFVQNTKEQHDQRQLLLSCIKAALIANPSDAGHLDVFIQENYLKGTNGQPADQAKIDQLEARITEQEAKIAELKTNQPQVITSERDATAIQTSLAEFDDTNHGIKFDSDAKTAWIDTNRNIDPTKLHNAIKDIPADKQQAFFEKLKLAIGPDAFAKLKDKVYTEETSGQFKVTAEPPSQTPSPNTGLTDEQQKALKAFEDSQKGIWPFIKNSTPFVALASLIGAVWAFVSGSKSKDDTKKQLQAFIQQLGGTIQGTLGDIGSQIQGLSQQVKATRDTAGQIALYQNKAIEAAMNLNYEDDKVESMHDDGPAPVDDSTTTDEPTPTPPTTPKPQSSDPLNDALKGAKELEAKAKNKASRKSSGSSDQQDQPSSSSGASTTQQPNTMQPLAPGQSPLMPQQGLTGATPGVVSGYGSVPSGMQPLASGQNPNIFASAPQMSGVYGGLPQGVYRISYDLSGGDHISKDKS